MNNWAFLLRFVVVEQRKGNKQINVLGFFLFPKKSMANILTVSDEGMCTGYYYGMRFLLVSFMA